MHGPAVVSWLLVAVCGLTGAYCLARARRGGAEERRAARLEAAMGLGMALMAVPHRAVPVPPLGFVALFAAAAAVAVRGALRTGARRRHLHHTVDALAMVYMALVMAGAAGGGPGHAGHAAGRPGGVPLLTGAVLLYFAVYVLRAGLRLAPAPVPCGSCAPPGTAGPAGVPGMSGAVGAPGPAGTSGPAEAAREARLAHACRLTLALGSFTMLLTL